MVHMQHNAYVVGACLIKCLFDQFINKCAVSLMHATFVQGIFHEEPNMTLNIVSIFSISLDLLADHLITHFHSLGWKGSQ